MEKKITNEELDKFLNLLPPSMSKIKNGKKTIHSKEDWDLFCEKIGLGVIPLPPAILFPFVAVTGFDNRCNIHIELVFMHDFEKKEKPILDSPPAPPPVDLSVSDLRAYFYHSKIDSSK